MLSPAEFESTPVSTYPRRGRLGSEVIASGSTNGILLGKKATATDTYQPGRYTVDSEVSVTVKLSGGQHTAPRQPHSLSLVDPAAPTRFFGSSGQRQVTVVKRGSGTPQALLSGDDSKWAWSSIEQLDEAINELVTGRSMQSWPSQASLKGYFTH